MAILCTRNIIILMNEADVLTESIEDVIVAQFLKLINTASAARNTFTAFLSLGNRSAVWVFIATQKHLE